MEFNGIYVPVVTPFKGDYSIDEAGYAAVVEKLVADGVHGIVVGGTTGEYYAQTGEERVHLLRLGIELAAGRVPVVAGTGAIRTEDSIALAAAARDAGADAILVTTPPYAQPTGAENAVHALAVQDAAGLPAMLYNYPGRMAAHMDGEFLDRVAGNPAFVAIKESSGDINRLHLLAREYPGIALSCGMDDQALEFFVWGAASWVCAAGNFAAGAHLALWRACVVDGDYERGRRIMAAMLPLMQVLEQGGKFVQSVKHGVSMRGIDAGVPRLPMQSLDSGEKRDLEKVVGEMDAAIEAIEGEGRGMRAAGR